MSDRRVIYTDGACPRNGQEGATGGIGVYWGPDHRNNVSRGITGDRHTNNVAEIQAATHALNQAREQGDHKVEIRTDSNQVAKAANGWIENWNQNGYRNSAGGKVENELEYRALDRARQGMDAHFTHVPREENTKADALAKDGAQAPQRKNRGN